MNGRRFETGGSLLDGPPLPLNDPEPERPNEQNQYFLPSVEGMLSLFGSTMG